MYEHPPVLVLSYEKAVNGGVARRCSVDACCLCNPESAKESLAAVWVG
jgi:hypothetical protein